MATAYTTALTASSVRLQHVNEILRPKLIATQTAALLIADQDSLEAAIAWAEVAAIGAAITSLQDDVKKYAEHAEDLRGEVDL